MLWIGGQITAISIIKVLILPSIINLIVPLLIITSKIKGKVNNSHNVVVSKNASSLSTNQQLFILFSGILVLILVPAFKTITHLPPYMGILMGLAIMWVITEIIGESKEEKNRYLLSPAHALRKIDTPSILFFLGILLCIAALERISFLGSVAQLMDKKIGNLNSIAIVMGLLSSIVDNVPLMAAAQGMYPLSQYPADHQLWHFLAYSTGTEEVS